MRPDKAFGIPLESLAEDGLALGDDVVRPTVVKYLGREQADAAVVVLGVVTGEEDLAEAAGVLDRAEAFGKLGPVLQGLELTFRERVVIGEVGPAVGLGDA